MRSFLFLIVAVALLAPTAATAGVVTYGDVSSFNAQGTIAYDSNFSDFPFQTFSFPGDNFYRGGVTYTNEQNLIVGPGYSIGATLNPSPETSKKVTGCRSLETLWRTGVAVAE